MSPGAPRTQGRFAAEQVGRARQGWTQVALVLDGCHFHRVTLPPPGWQDSQEEKVLAKRSAVFCRLSDQNSAQKREAKGLMEDGANMCRKAQVTLIKPPRKWTNWKWNQGVESRRLSGLRQTSEFSSQRSGGTQTGETLKDPRTGRPGSGTQPSAAPLWHHLPGSIRITRLGHSICKCSHSQREGSFCPFTAGFLQHGNFRHHCREGAGH